MLLEYPLYGDDALDKLPPEQRAQLPKGNSGIIKQIAQGKISSESETKFKKEMIMKLKTEFQSQGFIVPDSYYQAYVDTFWNLRHFLLTAAQS